MDVILSFYFVRLVLKYPINNFLNISKILFKNVGSYSCILTLMTSFPYTSIINVSKFHTDINLTLFAFTFITLTFQVTAAILNFDYAHTSAYICLPVWTTLRFSATSAICYRCLKVLIHIAIFHEAMAHRPAHYANVKIF